MTRSPHVTQRRSAFLLVGALALVAAGESCADDSVDVAIDPAFTTAQRGSIERAVNTWNSIALRRIVIVEDGEYLVLPALTPGGTFGYSQRTRHLLRVSPLTPDAQVYAVALHELGHALGLRHTRRGVMDPDRQTVDFSAEDMAECARAGACE